MPLPRFHRLSEDQRRQILDVARRELAMGTSFNRTITAAGISKASAYLYFDGKQDLEAEVQRDLAADLVGVLGAWTPAPTPEEFWDGLRVGGTRLWDHLAANPADAALLARWYDEIAGSGAQAWFRAVVADGQRLGVIRTDIDADLLVAATTAVTRAADRWAVDALSRGRRPSLDATWTLLAGMWRP